MTIVFYDFNKISTDETCSFYKLENGTSDDNRGETLRTGGDLPGPHGRLTQLQRSSTRAVLLPKTTVLWFLKKVSMVKSVVTSWFSLPCLSLFFYICIIINTVIRICVRYNTTRQKNHYPYIFFSTRS